MIADLFDEIRVCERSQQRRDIDVCGGEAVALSQFGSDHVERGMSTSSGTPGTALGTATPNQIILVQEGKITAVGGNVAIPAGAQVIDLTNETVLPGLVEAHNHLTMTLVEAVPLYGSAPKFSDRVFDSSPLLEMFVTDTTAYRALEGAGNAFERRQPFGMDAVIVGQQDAHELISIRS